MTGGAPKQISTNPKGERANPKGNMDLSADGKTIFFTQSNYFQNIDDVYSQPATGGAATRLSSTTRSSKRSRTYRLTARRSRISRERLAARNLPARSADVAIVAASVRSGPKFERNPSWSPDGRSLVFFREGDLWIRDASGGEPKVLIAAEYPRGNRRRCGRRTASASRHQRQQRV